MLRASTSLVLLLFSPPVASIGLFSDRRINRVPRHPGVPNTTLRWFSQPLDHFDFTEDRVWFERYLVYEKHYKPGGPILFYCGNEANVELYVNATGLMWERAAELNAYLVFAEHRYYGASLPLGPLPPNASGAPLRFLTMEQALADYARLIYALKANLTRTFVANKAEDVPVVAIGGSYGGMLAAWLRFHHPNAVNGAIAASAPVRAFDGLGPILPTGRVDPWTDGHQFWQVVTADASVKPGGCVAGCVDGVRATWPAIRQRAKVPGGLKWLSETFKLCGDGLKSADDVEALINWIVNVFDTLAMGNFPYPSNYLIYQHTEDPSIMLPAWPMRAACKPFDGAKVNVTPAEDLIVRMAQSVGVLYNASKAESCYHAVDPYVGSIWDWQWCTERLPQETYFSLTGDTDMFWSRPMDRKAIAKHCVKSYGVAGRPLWIAESAAIGGRDGGGGEAKDASNILFSNGQFDPWRSGGVLSDLGDGSITAVDIEGGAHHLDLFFADEADPPSVVAAREKEVAAIRGWVAAAERT